MKKGKSKKIDRKIVRSKEKRSFRNGNEITHERMVGKVCRGGDDITTVFDPKEN